VDCCLSQWGPGPGRAVPPSPPSPPPGPSSKQPCAYVGCLGLRLVPLCTSLVCLFGVFDTGSVLTLLLAPAVTGDVVMAQGAPGGPIDGKACEHAVLLLLLL
jgi:hypothetical protein